MRYDEMTFNESGFAGADIWISVSTDNGFSWSVSTNVTRTMPIGEPVPSGASLHEREPTLAETVTNGIAHLTYVLDHDAGSAPYGEGIETANEFIYQRIPVDSIATTPLVPNYPMHADSTGFLGVTERSAEVPREIMLHPAYPNPFNSTTTIRFDLPRRMQATLKVFDLLGREVETLQTGVFNAGLHRLSWSPQAASGLYFVRLQTDAQSRTQKLLLIR